MAGRMAAVVAAVVVVACALSPAAARVPPRAEPYVKTNSFNYTVPLDSLTLADGSLAIYTFGYGSGVTHRPSDKGVDFFSISDRGTNIDCDGEDEEFLGKDICDSGKIFTVPNFAPTIYKFTPKKGNPLSLVKAFQIKAVNTGLPVTGLPPALPDAEDAYDAGGNLLPKDPNGLDTECLAQLNDLSFWIGEEYAPSLAFLTQDGTMTHRYIPAGLESSFDGADYTVVGNLPAVLARRRSNRGIEAIALAPNEKELYFMTQSPLDNPKSAGRNSRNIRLFTFSLETNQVVAEYVYLLETPEAFPADVDTAQGDVKISDAWGFGTGKFLVDEHVTIQTLIFKVDVAGATNILGTKWDDVNANPSLESVDIAAEGIVPVKKVLVLDSQNPTLEGKFPTKVEGVAAVNSNTLILVNDNDFGFTGEITQFVYVKMPDNFLKN
eukprot:jgi/Chlat1/8081/Chrsp75S07547